MSYIVFDKNLFNWKGKLVWIDLGQFCGKIES